jgi:DNA primase
VNDQVDQVKTKTDIAAIIGERIELKKAGSNFKALCPFHSEKTPSFMVSPELQIFKCFGCGKSGDVITFLEEYEGMEFYEALKYLAQRVGIKLKPIEGKEGGIKERLFEVNSLVSRFYQYVLLKHPAGGKALLYLTKDRGLTRGTVEYFHLGYSPDQPLALKKFVMDRNKVAVEELDQAGVIYTRGADVVDRFRGRVIFPLFDHRGNTVGFAGRILPSDRPRDVGKYINSPETAIYHKSNVLYGLNEVRQEIKKQKLAVIVEGELDMISSWQAGIRNVVAIKGSALTEEQVKLLSRFTKSLVFALDADFAGNEAAMRGIKIAQKEGLEIRVAKLSKYKDPDEVARKNPALLKKFIENAIGVWDFIIDSVVDKYKGETGVQKAKISKELMPILASIDDKILQAHYISVVAKKLQVPVEAVTEEVANLSKNEVSASSDFVPTSVKQQRSRREVLEERLLSVIFRLDPLRYVKKGGLTSITTTPFATRLIRELAKYKTKKRFDISAFGKKLPKEMIEGFTDLILKRVEGLEDADEEKLEKELELVEKELRVLKVKEKLDDVMQEVQRFEESGDKAKLARAEREFSELTNKLGKLEA